MNERNCVTCGKVLDEFWDAQNCESCSEEIKTEDYNFTADDFAFDCYRENSTFNKNR